SSRRRHTRFSRDWSSDVCSSDLKRKTVILLIKRRSLMENAEIKVSGTLMWYYYICHREVWLMARHVEPESDHANLELGRFLQETAYPRNKKEVMVGHLKFDLVRKKDGQWVIGEVKKSSRYEKSAIMQLALYLYELQELGIKAQGELLFPEEKKRLAVALTPE